MCPTAGVAQESSQDLAKKLSNPISSLISIPVQMNYDTGFGPADTGERTFILNTESTYN